MSGCRDPGGPSRWHSRGCVIDPPNPFHHQQAEPHSRCCGSRMLDTQRQGGPCARAPAPEGAGVATSLCTSCALTTHPAHPRTSPQDRDAGRAHPVCPAEAGASAAPQRKTSSHLSGFPARPGRSWPLGGRRCDSCWGSPPPGGAGSPDEGSRESSHDFPPGQEERKQQGWA